MSRRGIVHLVGAGPGDPGLATQRAIDLISKADVIVYDRLVSPRLLDRARNEAELVYVGKEPGNPTMTQDEINSLLVERGKAGRQVVRLKGGDPFVFGRGGEEAQALRDAGVDFSVVPGVTAGVAAPAYAGIPVTHRDRSSAVAFVTAHEDPGKAESSIDWGALAAFPGTLVFYMGVKRLSEVAKQLIGAGRAPEEPAAVVERGTFAEQSSASAPLGEIAAAARAAGIEPPAITIVGSVARLGDDLDWFQRAPLRGKTVAVTRARAQASSLAERLTQLGAAVIEAPAIRIVPRIETEEVGEAVARLVAGDYDVVCVTSPNGAELLFEAVALEGRDARAFAGARLAALGPGTARALLECGLRADIVPPRSIGESLAEAVIAAGGEGRRILVARAAQARDVLPKMLRDAGAKVDEVALYATVREAIDPAAIQRLATADYVTFTSASTVRFFCEEMSENGGVPANARIVSIGPITSGALRELDLAVDVEAEQHDLDGLVDALVADVTRDS